MTIGKFLRDRREKAGMTQFEVSLATRVQQAQLSDYEHDKTMPSAARFFQIARQLGVDVVDLTVLELEMEDSDDAKGLYLDYI